MATRRQFLAGMLATGLIPAPSWADAGAPRFLTAAKTPTGAHVLVGLRDDLIEAFRLPLQTRGHAATAHPTRPLAVAFARRPGTYALIIDCLSGKVSAQLDAPEGRHFYGHGAFSPSGDLLFTAENDYENARGLIGIWDARQGYKRAGECDSGGIGPHEIALMPDGETLVIANGGIETHPESGRAKLNIPMMRPNLAYCTLDGTLTEVVEPEPDMRRNSIRHLAVAADGTVSFGMQWQGDQRQVVPLVGTHRRGAELTLMQADPNLWQQMQGYVGSVAISEDGHQVAVTSPRGNIAALFDRDTHQFSEMIAMEDVCGIAFSGSDLIATTGKGIATSLSNGTQAQTDLAFDNHLLRL